MKAIASELRLLADNDDLMEVARKKIEETLIAFRDSRISVLRNNGLVCREHDGGESSVIRLGPEDAVRIGLLAIASALDLD